MNYDFFFFNDSFLPLCLLIIVSPFKLLCSCSDGHRILRAFLSQIQVLELCSQVRKAMCSLESGFSSSSSSNNNNNSSSSQSCSLPFFNAWSAFLRETERAAEITKANADVISNKLVETFGAIVGEKKFSRKKYVEGRSSLESEVEKAVVLGEFRPPLFHVLYFDFR